MNKKVLGNLGALCFGLFLVFVLLLSIETGLRYYYKDSGKFFYSFSPELVNHVDLFKRSPIPKKSDPAIKVFCLGGSTTNGCNMPIAFSYPNILDSMLNKKAKAYNYGISGVNSVTTNYFVENIVSEYNPSCVVMHDGYNDLPVVIKKTGEDEYEYITPDYRKPYNPHIENPVIRYIVSLFKFNFRAIRRFVVTFVKKKLHKGGDLFLGFDYKQYDIKKGSSKDIYQENKKRMRIMYEAEFDTIAYCMKNGIKVIVILEPYIKPLHWTAPFGTGFRDAQVGQILSECHKLQQSVFLMALLRSQKDNPDLQIIDLREAFKGKYDELFYDECHLNGKGNAVKANIVYNHLKKWYDV